jgi:hypothetical protein
LEIHEPSWERVSIMFATLFHSGLAGELFPRTIEALPPAVEGPSTVGDKYQPKLPAYSSLKLEFKLCDCGQNFVFVDPQGKTRFAVVRASDSLRFDRLGPDSVTSVWVTKNSSIQISSHGQDYPKPLECCFVHGKDERYNPVFPHTRFPCLSGN